MNDGNQNLGPRPAAHQISFSEDCFEVVGIEESFFVAGGGANYPHKFAVRADAEAYARVVRRSVRVESTPVRRRVRWY